MNKLPQEMVGYFWDYTPDQIDLEKNKNFIIGRILQTNFWTPISWLRKFYGDPAIREWLLKGKTSSISSKQLRYWEIVLDLDPNLVNSWRNKAKTDPWNNRCQN